MKSIKTYRIPATLCALAVLLCDLLARPSANMGIIDDGAYVPMAYHVAATGHIAYTGWATAMLGAQLYIAAFFIRLFGFSFTTVRMSTVVVATCMAFVLQRTFVRMGISERNAIFGTLALALSPLYLMLSITYMSDITGLFGIVLCLYGCLRSLQTTSGRHSIAWLFFAVSTNALFGTSRQIAWLGILVMVPSTLWLLHGTRRVLIAGATTTVAGALFVLACMEWLKRQPYIIPEHLNFSTISPKHVLEELGYLFLAALFLLLPVLTLFFSGLRKTRLSILLPLSVVLAAYLVLAIYPSHWRGNFPMGPFGECVNAAGIFAYPILQGTPPEFLPRGLQALLTLLALGGLLGLLTQIGRFPSTPSRADAATTIPWHSLRILLVPYSVAYAFLISQRGATLEFHDRYLLGLLIIAVPLLLRYYQECASSDLPLASVLIVAVMAIYATAANRQMFNFYRARVALASELLAAGVPATAVDNGWEYNFGVELQNASYINTPGIEVPPDAYQLPMQPPPGACPMNLWDHTPHIHPLYGVSFDPNACYGPAPFAPVHYSRWPYATPGTLYVVRYVPPTKP